MTVSTPSRSVAGAVARRPALAVLGLFIVGICLAGVLPPRPMVWAVLLLPLLGLAMWRLRGRWICAVVLAAAIVLAGCAIGQLDQFFFSANEVSLFSSSGPQLVNLEMRLVDWPHLSGGTAEMRTLPYKQIATADVTAIQTRSGWQPASGRVSVMIEPPLNTLEQGQTIRALGFIERPNGPANPGEFDFAAYDRRRRILAEVRIRRAETIQIVARPGGPVAYLRRSARQLLGEGFADNRKLDAAFLRMLLLGDPDPRLNDVREDFTLTGTSYLLSISGLHIAILAGSLLLLLRLGGVGPGKSVVVSLAFVAVYAAVVNSTETGLRALVMCVAAAIGLLGRRCLDALQLWIVAILAILIAAPSDLYDTGFQIGAAAVLGLILFIPGVAGFLRGLTAPDDPWPKRKAAHGIWLSLAKEVGRRLWQTLVVSAVIWVVVLPIVARYFQQINPWAVPAGVLLLPVMSVALIAGAMKILLTLMCPWFAAWWAAGASGPVHVLHGAIGLLSRLPGASVTAAEPSAAVMVIYYALLALPLAPWFVGHARWAARLGPVAACLLIFLLPASSAAVATPAPAPGGVRVTLLAIGAGQTALVRVAGGQTFFVDCGSDTVSDVYRKVIHPYLLNDGVRRIDEILLSHGDYDHISAAWEIVQDYRVPVVRMTPHFRGHASGDPASAAQSLLHHLDTLGPAPTLTCIPDRIDVGGGATLEILWPPRECAMNSNDCGMVVKLNYGRHAILFPADIQVAPELALLKHPEELKADVLIAPHHGSAESSTLSFVKAVGPQVILCSSSRPLTHKQEVFDQLARPWPVYRTDPCGTIDLTMGRDGHIDVRGYVGETAKASVH